MLTGPNVVLRARKPSDVEVLHRELYEDVANRVRSDERPWVPVPVEQSTFRIREEYPDDVAIFTVAAPDTDEVLGSCLLWGIDRHNRAAHIGMGLVPSARGRGLGGETVRLLCDYGFRILGLNRIGIETLTDNDPMIRTAESAGFVREGTLREAGWVSGAMADEAIYGLLAADWQRGQ